MQQSLKQKQFIINMNIAIAFFAFLVVAVILWAVGELNYKNFQYVEDQPHHPDPTAHQGGEYRELTLQDILRDNSTKGYDAV
ncbi:MAG: hypothetical protein LIR46_01910 [Bacteroidota bacterium]|nr:hypothetical protein [Bacteroidota bacterium]